jgi:tripartite-type tricarboxylate transporter receptor subunit TctC
MIATHQHKEIAMHRRVLLKLSCTAALATKPALSLAQLSPLPPSTSHGQDVYPSKTVRVVVPFVPGSPGDTLARLLGPALSESMAASVVVENVPGAGGTIGVDRVAKAAADGYTLLMSGDAALVLTGGAFGVKPPYETLRDLAPIAQLIITPNVLVVSNEVPARSVQDLVALVRSQPGRFSYASSGIGVSQHRAGELMNSMAGLDMVHVPNPTNAWLDVIAGRTQIMFGNIALALPMVKEGKVRALGVTSTTRAAALPDLPTVSESGLPGFEALAWFGLLAPAGTPPAVLQRLEAEVQKVMATPAIKERVAAMGAMPGAQSAAGLTRVIQDEIKRWAPMSSASTDSAAKPATAAGTTSATSKP